ncbi:helicase [Paenibacillus sp. VTT E-133280]|uniref:DEAD/DEAH box helicase n=1 Tax=Paenibacillus sp. VTT E-133280 TaxID=1986222 RepID=UPI000B9FEE4F|nr:DEAD/DEAH box helicase [Paenibacillus sp. VTT E-133280]OZQ67681.1 helicase [Paenibacillus sp. VTT E-133280]
MLRIMYEKDSHRIILSIAEHSFAWLEIRRLCEEQASECSNTSATSLELPWWEFLSIKEQLKYIFQKHHLKVNIDTLTQELLKKSLLKHKSYIDGCNNESISKDQIIEVLKKAGFRRSLTDLQLRNLSKLCKFNSAASFSVPGAGKTTEALAYFYFKKTLNTKLIIIAPKNAFAAWEQQIELCLQNPPQIVRLRGGYQTIKNTLKSEPEIIMITYQQLPTVSDLIADYMSRSQFFMFIDESHRMKKGTKGKIGATILNLSHLPESKLILSGTPMPNGIIDLVPQFNFLYPELNVDEERVVDHIQNIYVRTTKEELDLGERFITAKIISMTERQRRLYNLLKSEVARESEALLKAHDRNTLRSIGKSVLRLIQLTSNPALLANTDFNYHPILRDVLLEGDSPKISYVCNRARELASQGKKTIIWSSFVANVELITLRLRDIGADYIHGGVDSGEEEDSETREAKVKRFHEDPNAFVLVANPAAASEGISLHEVCHNAIYLDRNYNAAHFLQSMDRIHRYGPNRHIPKYIEVVICPNSIDESVNRRLEDKINLMADVLNDSSLRVGFEYTDETDDEIAEDNHLDDEDVKDILNHFLEEGEE